MQVTMKDRVAVVTGGSKGIGLAVARQICRLRRQGRDPRARRGGPEGGAGAACQGRPRSSRLCLRRLEGFRHCRRRMRRSPPISARVDILVNNAGTARTMAFENISDEAWQEDLDLKLFAAIRFSRLVWPGMKARKWGRIINVLNTGAKAPAASSAPTSVSRAAGMALTKVMANEGGEHNILVNAMLVGLIMSDQWVKRHAKQAPDTDFEVFTRRTSPRAPRSGGSARRRNSPTWPASSPPSRAPTSPAPPSMSMAAVRRWCSVLR